MKTEPEWLTQAIEKARAEGRILGETAAKPPPDAPAKSKRRSRPNPAAAPDLPPLMIPLGHTDIRPDPVAMIEAVPAANVVARVTLLGEPVSKARPRFSAIDSSAHTPKKTRVYERAVGTAAMAAAGGWQPDPRWAFGVRAAFFTRTRQKKDVDNMIKAILDGLNGVLFVDDRQVREVMGWGALDSQHPRVEFVVYRLFVAEAPQDECQHCGKVYRTFASWRSRRYCSQACSGKARRSAIDVQCDHCGKAIRRIASKAGASKTGRHYCSKACIVASRPARPCEKCGATVIRPASQFKGRVFCSQGCWMGASSPASVARRGRRRPASEVQS